LAKRHDEQMEKKDKQIDGGLDRWIDGGTERQMDRQTEGKMCRQIMKGHTFRHIADRQARRQKSRRTGRKA
jgi:hypothetical protein